MIETDTENREAGTNNLSGTIEKQVLLTVITPSFQSRAHIEACLRSVIEQDCRFVEHLIVDGGSTDGTVEVIRQYAQRYSHIRWICERDNGQSDAMNKGVRLATGRFIGFLNVDDYYEPGALNYAVETMKTLREPAFLSGNCRIWDHNGRLLRINKPRKLDVPSIILTWVFPCNPAAYFYHKSLHEKVGYYDEKDHDSMDLEFILRALPAAHVKYVDKILGNYRLLEDTKTFRSMQEGRIDGIIRGLFKIHYERLPWASKIYVTIAGKTGWVVSKILYYGNRLFYYLLHPKEAGKFLRLDAK